MNCVVCDGSTFALVDGTYCCEECNTQVQSSRQEECDQDGFSRRLLLKSTVKKRERKLKERKFYADWITPEAYTVVLREQVSALISLGASDNLKDVVLNIWCRYLQKCKIAFRNDPMAKTSIVPCLGTYAYHRDKAILYGDKARRKRAKKPDINMSDVGDSNGEQVTDSTLAESDYLSNEMDNGSISESSVEDIPLSKKVKLSSKLKKGHPKDSAQARERYVDEMDLTKTLCFCYLGLLYTGDNILLSDILRLVNERKIPYLDAAKCIQSSLELQFNDFLIFTKKKAPDMLQISLMSARLIDFLELPKFKHRSLMPIVYCFVTDLNLPGRIILVVQYLFNILKENECGWYEVTKISKTGAKTVPISRIPVYEAKAMAAIIVALKLFYVLDGEYELDHSEAMMKINILLKSEKLFVWNEWRHQMSLKEFLFMKNETSCSAFSNLDMLSADVIAKYPFVQSKDNSEDEKHRNFRSRKSRTEIQSMLQQLLHTDDPTSDEPSLPSSFPFKSQLANMMSNWKKWHFFKETENIDFTFINKDFSSRLLFYKYEEENEDSIELIHILLSSLYNSEKIYTLSHSDSFSQDLFRTSSKYWFKNIPERARFHSTKWMEQLPESFVWLLQLLSNYIPVNCSYLYSEIQKIEKKLMDIKFASLNVG